MRSVKGKIIVITGASSGIGKYLADALRADNTVEDLSRSSATPCDVSDEQSVRGAFERIRELHGRVDILVNNAGYGISGATEMMPAAEVDRLFAVNFRGVFLCMKYALPLMGAGSKIVNISSACALFPLPFRGFYCASKAAVSSLSDAVREEVRCYGIDVTAICPGDIKTPFTANRVKNFEGGERYGERVRAADERVSGREDKRMSLGYAGRKILAIIGKRRFKPQYIIGKKYKMLYFLGRLFPKSAVLGVTGKAFAPGKGNKK